MRLGKENMALDGYGHGAAVAVIIIIIIIIIVVAVFAGLNNGTQPYLIATGSRRDEDSVAVSRGDLRALCGQL